MPKHYDWGLRKDKTKKGPGFLGTLRRPDGGVSTEISIGVNIEGRETEIPTLVPTLTQNEIDYLLEGKEPTKEIKDKAIEHAVKRIKEGKSPFADEDESPKRRMNRNPRRWMDLPPGQRGGGGVYE